MSEMGKEQSLINTIPMLGFQNPGIILWSRHSIGGLSCLGGGRRSRSALVQHQTKQGKETQPQNNISDIKKKPTKINISYSLIHKYRTP